jgi:hypothetical protein
LELVQIHSGFVLQRPSHKQLEVKVVSRKVQLTPEILEQLETVRAEGKCEWFDIGWVIGELTAQGHTKAALWVSKNPHTYSRLILHGSVIGDTLDTDSGEEIGESVVEQMEDHFAEDDQLKREQGLYDETHCPQCNATNVVGREADSQEVSEPIDDLDDCDLYHVWFSIEYICQECGYIWYEDESDSFVV